MQTGTLLLIILSAIASLAIVLYQYYYRSKSKGTTRAFLSFFRFLALLGIFLLLINPKFTKNEFVLEKSNLLVLLDNSSSLNSPDTRQQIEDISQRLKAHGGLNEHFNSKSYSFGKFLNSTDSLSYTEKATNISKALSTINDIYSRSSAAVVLVTDGNQTLGEDYEFYGKQQDLPVYPVVLGDTTQYADIRVDQLNTNRYAFLNNKFPLEVYVSYQGEEDISSLLTVSVAGIIVHRQRISLNNTANTKIVNTLIDASSVGVKEIKVKMEPLRNERNTANNERVSAVEVIDEKTNIAIISEVLHPDIGALKKAIESNEQRSVEIKRPNTPLAGLADVDLFILYQPRSSFREIYNFIKDRGASIFTITGAKTDWNFLNSIQNSFEKNSYNQSEYVSPILNPGFTVFDVSGFSIEDFPPLEAYLGEILITKSSETVLGQEIKGVDLNEPLLCIIGNDKAKEAVLFGENIWKWRAQSYRNHQDFKPFDEFIGKFVLYLSLNDPKSRLSLDYQNTYEGISEAGISASYFDETFVFDSNASITLSLKNKDNTITREIPMLLLNGYYNADLSNLPSGQYSFTVSVENEDISKSGSFTMLDFDVEKQFYSSDYRKLERLANATNASLYYPSQLDQLIDNLLADAQFVPTQKSNQNVVSLIDFRILLAIVIMALTTEWFIRKYNGLI